MANLKEIRNRIASVSSTMQITSAMKMVSAAKLKRAQDAITQMRPYAEKLQNIIENINSYEGSSEVVYSQERAVKRILIVTISSNRGLCGAFNASVFKETEKRIKHFDGKDVELFPIGKRCVDYFSGKEKLFNSNGTIFDNLNYNNAAVIAQEVMDAFARGDFDHVEIIYNEFKNAATQEIVCQQFAPVKAEKKDDTKNSTNKDYLFEPSINEIVVDLIPKSLKVQLYKSLLDSHASEHGARMTAMHKATENAEELKAALKLTYNRQRQAAITNEILEIVGGAEALKKG